jgi:dipeptidyl aminopeptidase/acylaminoacyl peptidase
MRTKLILLFAFLLCAVFAPASAQTDADDPYIGITIPELILRTYGEGELNFIQTLDSNAAFTRELISFDSDEFTVYGFMNIPVGEGPFPVVIVIHGYVPPAQYQTLTYTTRYADALARAGYLVIHPNLRSHVPSDIDPRPTFTRVGYAVDVLNLIAHIQEQGGQPGVLEAADPNVIGVWGHSMGGGIVIRALTVNPDIQAAVLYGAMNADEMINYDRIYNFWTNGAEGAFELSTPPELMSLISPVGYLERIETPISIHHGNADADVPVSYSIDLCGRLTELEKPVECYIYEGAPHIFQGADDALFQERVVTFFDHNLRPPE